MTNGFLARLVRRTSIEALQAEEHRSGLRRALGGRDLIAIGLGTMIGGGIFTTIGPGVAKAGPAIVIAFLLAGLASFFAALCYAELGSMVPIAGSAYTYAYATLGQLVAWIIGWDLILEYAVSAAPVASAFSGAVQGAASTLWHVALPAWAQTAHWQHAGPWWAFWSFDPSKTTVDVVGALFILVLSALLVIGIKETAASNNTFVVVKIAALVVFVIAGLSLFHPSNLAPFAPLGWGQIAFGASGNGIVPAAALVFFTYIGFDTATTTAEETRNPKVDVPVGVLGSLAIGTLIYCTVALVLVGVVYRAQHVDQSAALLAALAAVAQPDPRCDHYDRRDRRHDLGRADVALGPVAHLLRDGARPDAAAVRRGNSPALQDAGAHDDDHGCDRRAADAHRPARRAARARQHRHVQCLHHRLRGRDLAALQTARLAAAVPLSARSAVWPARCAEIGLSVFLSSVGLGPFTWLRFVVWLLVGLVIYFCYGFRQPVPGELQAR